MLGVVVGLLLPLGQGCTAGEVPPPLPEPSSVEPAPARAQVAPVPVAPAPPWVALLTTGCWMDAERVYVFKADGTVRFLSPGEDVTRKWQRNAGGYLEIEDGKGGWRTYTPQDKEGAASFTGPTTILPEPCPDDG